MGSPGEDGAGRSLINAMDKATAQEGKAEKECINLIAKKGSNVEDGKDAEDNTKQVGTDPHEASIKEMHLFLGGYWVGQVSQRFSEFGLRKWYRDEMEGDVLKDSGANGWQKWYTGDKGVAVKNSDDQSPQIRRDPVSYDVTFKQHMLAGSVAGMVEHMAMFPIDTVKTRMQVLSAPGAKTQVSRAFSSILKSEGASGLYRGIGAMGLGAGPAHAVYFSVYEVCKEKFGGNREGHHPCAHALAGAVATTASDAVLTPMDVVKQRLQLKQSPYRGLVDCVRQMLKHEGIRAFYASYRTTVMMNIPFTAVHFASYEAVKKAVSPSDDETLYTHMTAGGVAGALASAITTPLDVVKTRLQTQGVCGAERFHSTSVLDVVRKIVAHEGTWALWKGLRPRVMFHTPAAAICWSTYEASKDLLQHWNEKQGH